MTDPLLAISPIDGRYRQKTNHLAIYFSESALIRTRIEVEVKYAQALHQFLDLPPPPAELTVLHRDFDLTGVARKIKQIEATTRHDVKAVEYFLRQFTDRPNLIHFGLTSQDINNPALTLNFKRSLEQAIIPHLNYIANGLFRDQLATPNLNLPMLARTHGQPATPTTLGKEFMVYHQRLLLQLNGLRQTPYITKFGGASGTLHAHYSAYPNKDWEGFANNFLDNHLDGLKRYEYTTQIDPYDNLAEHLDNLKRICQILIDFCQDVWLYISFNYFQLKTDPNEVGSSAMPHKVNPIDFENAEGNLLLASNLFTFLARQLTTSRLQRDLTDSTLTRNLGTPIAHLEIALSSLEKGISLLQPNRPHITNDLNNHSIVLSEAIQTILRTLPPDHPDLTNLPPDHPLRNPYDLLKQLTRTSSSSTLLDLTQITNHLQELGLHDPKILQKIQNLKLFKHKTSEKHQNLVEYVPENEETFSNMFYVEYKCVADKECENDAILVCHDCGVVMCATHADTTICDPWRSKNITITK